MGNVMGLNLHPGYAAWNLTPLGTAEGQVHGLVIGDTP